MRYHWLSVLSVLTVAPLAGLATPLRLAPPWDDMHVKHAWGAVPDNWESLGTPHPGATIDLYIALKPQNENALIDALYEVSTPRHPKYGAHLSKEDVAKLVAPHPDTLELVHSWLAHHGVRSSSISTTHGGCWLTLAGVPVYQANELLGASYQLYQYAGMDDTTILRTVGYALPKVLHAHIQTVAPTTFFASTRTPHQTPHRHSVGGSSAQVKATSRESVTALSNRDEPEEVTPEFLRWLYKTTAYVPAATGQNVLGVAGFRNEYPSPTDLELFMIVFRHDAVAATFTVEKVNGGGYDPSNPGIEANLDMQYAQAIAYPTPHVFYSTGGKLLWTSSDREPFQGDMYLMWVGYVLNQKNIPQTISMSYGANETALPEEYARSVCFLFAQLGAFGVSVISSSGDYGVGPGDCKDNSEIVQFVPLFPASCPWVTSVGGTRSSLPEVAASFSGGGFSKFFPRPSYQNVVVPSFLQRRDSKYDGLYNPANRGIPDMAAQAINCMIAVNTSPFPVSGTSCAAPVAAGIISLLNDYLISKGKPPLGFLNPWLYSDGLPALNDIISGSNPGCGTEGFSAIAGWDPVTGLGTPDFFKLQDVLFREVVSPEKQGRASSELLNNSGTAVPHSRHWPI